MMKALKYTASHADKIALVDTEKPAIKDRMALIAISAAALNHRDQWIREGKYPNIKDGVIMGSDACGTVVSTASESDGQWIGKKVLINPNMDWGNNAKVQSSQYKILGMPEDGTFAEYVAVPIDRLTLAPEHLSDEEAAALPLAGLTAYRALFTHGQLRKENKVLITGAGGGVSQIAILFAMKISDQVYITSGDEGKIDEWKRRGVADAFNYKQENWTKDAVKNNSGFDLIIDSSGGKQVNDLLKMINPGGKYVFYGASNGLPEKIDLFRLFWNQITVQGSTMGNDDEFDLMVKFVENYQIKPIVDSVFKLENALQAFEKMKAGRQLGKIVLKIN